jgi:hypothetical protein
LALAETDDISIYTVFYDENNDDSGAAFFEDLVRGEGAALRTPISADLAGTLRQPLRAASLATGSMIV